MAPCHDEIQSRLFKIPACLKKTPISGIYKFALCILNCHQIWRKPTPSLPTPPPALKKSLGIINPAQSSFKLLKNLVYFNKFNNLITIFTFIDLQ